MKENVEHLADDLVLLHVAQAGRDALSVPLRMTDRNRNSLPKADAQFDLLGREKLLSIREDHLLHGDDGRDEMFATLELLAPELIRDDLELKTRVVSLHRSRK